MNYLLASLRSALVGGVFLAAFLPACSTSPYVSTPDATQHVVPTGEERFVLSLYESIDVDLQPSSQGHQVGLGDADLGMPVDVFLDDELVGADWDNRIIEYDHRVRERYGDETATFIPNFLVFVIEYGDVRIVAGAVIEEINAAIIRFPVLAYRRGQVCEDDRVVFKLLPGYGGKPSTDIPGLTPELDSDIGEYLSDRRLECALDGR